MQFSGMTFTGGFNFYNVGNPAQDPYFNYTTLLLPGNGTNNGTNNTFIDGSTNNLTITRNNNTTQGTFSPFSQTGWSNNFDGNDCLTASNAALAFGTGQFCIEAWMYNNSLKNYSCLVTTRPNNGNYSDAYHIGWDSAGGCSLYVGTTSRAGAPAGTIKAGVWQHFVCCRNASNLVSIFVDGVRVGTETVTSDFTRSLLGIGDFPTTQAEGIIGFISNLRLIKGSTPYDPTQTTITVPTAPLTAITNTSLLTCQNNRIVDNSGNNLTLTKVGDTNIQSFSPFNATSTSGVGTIGGSAYFDGTTDNLLINYNTALNLSGDFTIECWLYPKAAQSTGMVINFAGGYNIAWASYELVIDGSYINFAASSANSGYDIGSETGATGRIGTLTLNAWNHIAVTRSGNTYRGFLNGVQGYTQTLALTPYDPNARGLAIGGGYSNTWGVTPDTATYITGFVSGLRIVKGTAVYTSNFAVPTSPPTAISNTSLLLNYTNGQIVDATSKNNLETIGDTKISTTQSKWGGSSMYFDGTGDRTKIPAAILNSLGTNNFTIEMWVYPMSATGYQCILLLGGSAPYIYLGINTGSSGTPFMWNDANVIVGSQNFTINAWQHWAIVRSSGTVTMYLNGTNIGSASFTGNLVDNLGLYLGATNASTQYFTGYINDLRVTRGIARYTSNFTPPTQAFPLF